MDLTDIYRTLNPKAEDDNLFSTPHGTFSEIDHILRNKANLHKYKKKKNGVTLVSY